METQPHQSNLTAESESNSEHRYKKTSNHSFSLTSGFINVGSENFQGNKIPKAREESEDMEFREVRNSIADPVNSANKTGLSKDNSS
jgi:hypothetical protein